MRSTGRARLPHLTAVIAVAALLAGCAAAPPRSWRELRSPNFLLVTDLPESHAATLTTDLERFRSVVQRMAHIEHMEPRLPTRIYAFASTTQAREFMPDEETVGVFLAGWRSNLIAMDSTMFAKPVLYHEYAHFLSRNQTGASQPLWYSEGYAEFLAAFRVDGDDVIFGGVLPHRSFSTARLLPYGDVIRTRSMRGWSAEQREQFYAQSWLIVHYFTLGPGRTGGDLTERLARYVAGLDRTGEEDAAFADAFGMNLDQLDRTLRAYAEQRRIPALRRPLRRFEPAVDYTSIQPAPADVDTQLGWLALRGGHTDLAEQLFTQAISADPQHARAHAGLGAARDAHDDWVTAAAQYAQALQLAPDDFENHLDYGAHLVRRATANDLPDLRLLNGARDHFTRAIRLAPDNPEGHARLGSTYLIAGEDPAPGIASLGRALELLPSETRLHLQIARLYLKAGRQSDARGALEQVLRWSHGGDDSEDAASLLATMTADPSPGRPALRAEH